MSDYPLLGNGIEIHENEKESVPDRRKYTIFVQEDLYPLIVGDDKLIVEDDRLTVENDKPKTPWVELPRIKRKFLAYESPKRLEGEATYPLRGEGIEIRNEEESRLWGEYKIYVHSNLQAKLVKGKPAEHEDKQSMIGDIRQKIANIKRSLKRLKTKRGWPTDLKQETMDLLIAYANELNITKRPRELGPLSLGAIEEIDNRVKIHLTDSYRTFRNALATSGSEELDCRQHLEEVKKQFREIQEILTKSPSWGDETGEKRKFIGYYATDQAFSLTRGDTPCT